jgi:hypothetical protein
LFLYVCELIGGIYFIWMLAYLVIRFYNGAHEKEVILRYGFKRLEALNEQFQTYYMENNPLIGIVIIALTIASLVAGYLVGGEGGLWCGAVIAIIIVALGQHQYKLRK